MESGRTVGQLVSGLRLWTASRTEVNSDTKAACERAAFKLLGMERPTAGHWRGETVGRPTQPGDRA